MKKIKVKYSLPINYEEWMKTYFLEKKNEKVTIPFVQKVSKAFVSNQGLVIRNFFLLKGCAFNLLGFRDRTFYLPFWKLTFLQMLVCKFGKSLKSVELDSKNVYLLIHSKWFNYSFWINSYLLRLIQAEESSYVKNIKLIFPEEWNDIRYVKESLECFNIDIEVIPRDTHVFVKNLIMPHTRDWTASFLPGELDKVRLKVLPYAIKKATFKKDIKRVYLTRKNSRSRSVLNEEELVAVLDKYNFTRFSFDDISFWDQVFIMSQLECFISIHGAGFSNVIFMQEGTSVLELVNQSYADIEYKFPFWKMTVSSNLKYYVQFGKIASKNTKLVSGANPKPNANYLVDENIYIDPILFEKNIKLMLEN
ncbi:MAG: glycosyltransferase family 61 protein [Bacteroidia bacterium]|nr:glycosyltransferase family 61 protein [Bacteroidia bacterium]